MARVILATMTAVLAASSLAACGGDGASEGGDGADAAAVVTTATEVGRTAVPEALAFSGPLVGGGTFDGAAYTGRPVAFWFWAPY